MGNIEFGKRLKAYRLRRKWTLAQMSAVTGIAISALWAIERGKVTPQELTVARIQDALPDLPAVA